MLAGSICDEADCTELLLFVLAVALAAFVVAMAIALAWAFVIARALRRRGWSALSRRSAAGVGVVVGAQLMYRLTDAFPELRGPMLWMFVVPPIPLLIWQRRLHRLDQRHRDQSSPCSTA